MKATGSEMKWRNKVVWLTGASSGIGEALVRRLAGTGCRLAITARRGEVLEALASECGKERVRAFPGDVTDLERMKAVAADIRAQWGAVDVLITNAGTYLPTDPATFDSLEYDRIMKLNYSGSLYCIEAVLPEMLSRRRGLIVGVSSLVGYRGLPRSCSYGATKAALINFLEGLRFDLKRHGVGVTIVNPGFVRTPLTEKNDFAMPFIISAEDAADIIVEGIRRGKKEIHFPWQFSWLLKALRVIPYPLYELIVSRRTSQ
jgi:short-subunit dehydrogenase